MHFAGGPGDAFRRTDIGTGVPDFVAAFVLEWVRNMNAGEWEEQTADLETLIGQKPKTAAEFFRDDYVTVRSSGPPSARIFIPPEITT